MPEKVKTIKVSKGPLLYHNYVWIAGQKYGVFLIIQTLLLKIIYYSKKRGENGVLFNCLNRD